MRVELSVEEIERFGDSSLVGKVLPSVEEGDRTVILALPKSCAVITEFTIPLLVKDIITLQKRGYTITVEDQDE